MSSLQISAACFALSILFGRQAEVVAGADDRLIESQGATESVCCFVCYDPVRFGHEGLTKIGLTVGCLSEYQQGTSPSAHRIRVAAKLQIDRRQHLPPATILGIFFQMGLNLSDGALNRRLMIGWRATPCGRIFRRQFG